MQLTVRLWMRSGRFLQVSGLAFEWAFADDDTPTVSNVQVGGKPLSEFGNALLTVATSSFLANGGDGYSMLRVDESNGLGMPVSRAVSAAPREHRKGTERAPRCGEGAGMASRYKPRRDGTAGNGAKS